MIYLKFIVFNYNVYYDMYIYVLFNILDTFIYYIYYINIYRVMSYFIDRSKKN